MEILETLSEKYPEVEIAIEYDEPGNNLAGKVTWYGGEKELESTYDSPTIPTEDDWLDSLLNKLNDLPPINDQPCKRFK